MVAGTTQPEKPLRRHHPEEAHGRIGRQGGLKDVGKVPPESVRGQAASNMRGGSHQKQRQELPLPPQPLLHPQPRLSEL